ncbi:MAG: HEAT repeat domain-containing protein, partial [Planctomycetia bacterium]
PEGEVVPAVNAWIARLDPKSPTFEHDRLEGLWMLRHFDQVPLALLEQVLTSPFDRSRAAAMRVLAGIVDRAPKALEWVVRGAGDSSPRVRLEAVRTATFLRDPAAIEALAVANDFPSDRHMDYVKRESARVLEPEFRRARDAKQPIAFRTDAGKRYLYGSMNNDELAAEPRSTAVFREMLLRPGLDERLRQGAVEGLAADGGTSVVRVAVDALGQLDAREGAVDPATVFDLIRVLLSRPAAELAELRGDMERMATQARRPQLRRIGDVALTAIDAMGGADPTAKVWDLAKADPRRLVDFVEALPLVSDPGVRTSLYDRILPLLDGIPGVAPAKPGTVGRYVRVELPGKQRTLTLAEVEVFADGENVARSGKASQVNVGSGGEASRGIDGNTDPEYGKGGQTHTQEGIENPWWEVDLGSPKAIERVLVWNRGDGLAGRLQGYTLSILDDGRATVFRVENQPAPERSAEIAVASDEARLGTAVRRAAFSALAGVRGREKEVFERIAPFIIDGTDRDAAIAALERIPVAQWPADRAPALVAALMQSLGKATVEERSSDAGLSAWQFAENLTTLLPAAEGKARRAELADLGVRVVRIGTVYERMNYDKETVTVQAGRPVLFVFQNADVMPHNFVVAKPGTMQALGETAERLAQDPGFAKRAFVPESADVLLASTLLQPQAMQ